MPIPSLSKEQICQMFGCTMEQLNAQYASNAGVLKGMHEKAKRTGKKVNGYTEQQLKAHTARYKRMANPATTNTLPDSN